MRCPYCGNADTQVKDSRPSEDGAAIRRRRNCPDCGGRFTTFERVQLRELQVVKRSGRRVPFDRDKLMRSVQIALRKRPVEPERVERMVSGLVRRLESLGESEIKAELIGKLVMEGLRGLDDVAYVRFASVYKNFREAKDFEELLGELTAEDEGAAMADRGGAAHWVPACMNGGGFAQLMDELDARWMEHALRLGRRTLGATGANPAVGCVIVAERMARRGGVDRLGGRPHAETRCTGHGGRCGARRHGLCDA
jgi:transcriptional repressor NrdR